MADRKCLYLHDLTWPEDEGTENGALGDATKATPEIGRIFVEMGLDRISDYLWSFMER